MKRPKSVEVSLNLPWGLGGVKGTWEPDEEERKAAWEMYVELVTRVTVVDLGPNEGLLREALSSIYSLFETTRLILRQHGPSLAQPKGNGEHSFGELAVIVLNQVLRPVLSKWHPLLLDYENSRPARTSQLEWERKWAHHDELRSVLKTVRSSLTEYSSLLATVAGVQPLISDSAASISG
jgi:hypothetical protein